MAERQKTIPPLYEVTVPKAIAPLMQAFHVDSEKAAKSLILEAARAVYGSDEMGLNPFAKNSFSKEALASISSLMQGIYPRDTLETLYAAQIVVSHMLGMRRLSSSNEEEQKLGLKLLRFSNEAMQHLAKKRHGGNQNITVNYNYNGQGPALMQTILPEKAG
jgi:hypothetical protein